MSSRILAPGLRWLLVAALCAPSAAMQDGRSPAPTPSEMRALEGGIRTLEGFVLGPEGLPAEGAVVVSSAGGKAVTDASGWYRLQASLPSGVESIQVTAIGARQGLLASARVAVAGSMGRGVVEPLLLAAGGCSPGWLPTFGHPPGTDGTVFALVIHDDGGGPDLYVGGEFTRAGGESANHVARWDGTEWSVLGGGMDDSVRELLVYDDGTGPALHAAGFFTTAGGVPAKGIARWDGTSWSALGGGMNAAVRFVALHDDGGGPALYAGGPFTVAGGVVANHVARWDGSSWSALGSGVDGDVFALASYDDGNGAALYVGGGFSTAGGLSANRIAKWTGSSWAPLNSSMDGTVYALTVHDDGGGPRLFAGGNFTTIDALPFERVAAWDGSSWSPLGGGFATTSEGGITAFAVFDDGGGDVLYAGGDFQVLAAVPNLARWDGTAWTSPGTVGLVKALAVHDDGSGPALFVGGAFDFAAGLQVGNLVRWDGSSWGRVGKGMEGDLYAMTAHDDGSGPALYAGGSFEVLQGVAVNGIARWDGASWSALGTGIVGTGVLALAVHDDGGGPALFAGGLFSSMGGGAASNIAKWDGASWSPLGTGIDGRVSALAVYDDGGGPALFAGGSFTTAGGVTARNIARWDGASWSALPGSCGFFGDAVEALAVYDDGSGPALFLGGNFRCYSSSPGIARWNGVSWSGLAGGVRLNTVDGTVLELAVYDDGGGPALFAGGQFTHAGGQAASRIARWDGTGWSALGSGVLHLASAGSTAVTGLSVHDDGSGPALYAAGTFTRAGGQAAMNVARWDGANWSPLGGGLSPHPFDEFVIFGDLVVYDDGGGPSLFAGGAFLASDSGDTFLARWGSAPDLEPPTLACPPSVLVLDSLGGPPGETVTFSVTASDCRDPAPSVVCMPPSGSHFPPGTTLVTCTATDAAGNQSVCQFPLTVQIKARRR